MSERGAEHFPTHVATTEFRAARFPGTRKDDNGGRFPGSPARAVSQAFPRSVASVAVARDLAGYSCGNSRSGLRSLLALSGTACGQP